MESGWAVTTQGLGKEKATQSRGNRREVREGIRYMGVAVLVELMRDTWGLAMPGDIEGGSGGGHVTRDQ